MEEAEKRMVEIVREVSLLSPWNQWRGENRGNNLRKRRGGAKREYQHG